MDPVTLIVAALVAGAAAGGKDVASSAIKDAYGALKRLLSARFRNSQPPEVATRHETLLDDHEADPATWEKPLDKALRESRADQDEAILDAAKKLLQQADPDGRVAKRYNIDLRGAAGVQTGDHSTQTNYFGRGS